MSKEKNVNINISVKIDQILDELKNIASLLKQPKEPSGFFWEVTGNVENVKGPTAGCGDNCACGKGFNE